MLALQSIFDVKSIHIDETGPNIAGYIFIKPEISGSVTLEAYKNDQYYTSTVKKMFIFHFHSIYTI